MWWSQLGRTMGCVPSLGFRMLDVQPCDMTHLQCDARHPQRYPVHGQALEKAKAAKEEVERFTAALPPLPVWDSLPAPATGRDKLDPAADVKAEGGDGAQPQQTGSAQDAAVTAAPSSAEAVPATGPNARPAAGPGAASGDAPPVEAQPFATCDPPADPVADALATAEAAADDAAAPAAAGLNTAMAPTDAANIEAEALAAADLAADSSVRDRRCGRRYWLALRYKAGDAVTAPLISMLLLLFSCLCMMSMAGLCKQAWHGIGI